MMELIVLLSLMAKVSSSLAFNHLEISNVDHFITGIDRFLTLSPIKEGLTINSVYPIIYRNPPFIGKVINLLILC